jgi:alpha-galactosidase/6-phospho-beta-glucosidase family protein
MPNALSANIAPIGHNRAPFDADSLRSDLIDEFRSLFSRRDELLAAETRIPPIGDEDTARKISDFVKQLSAAIKASDAARVNAKEPFLEGGRVIDGVFRQISDPLTDLKKKVERKLTDYLRAKEAEERERRQREEREARERAEQARREAEAAAQAMRDAASLDEAVQAEKAAEAAAADVVKAEAAATAKPAELSRTRGEYGAVSSLRTEWVFEGVDRATIDLETLRPYLPADGIEKAIRSFIRAGGRDLRGTRIYETTNAVVR